MGMLLLDFQFERSQLQAGQLDSNPKVPVPGRILLYISVKDAGEPRGCTTIGKHADQIAFRKSPCGTRRRVEMANFRAPST